MSSTNVSATSAAASAQWQQSAATQDNSQDHDTGFAALLDAAAASDTPASPAVPRTAPADQPATKPVSTSRDNGANAGQPGPQGPTTTASANAASANAQNFPAPNTADPTNANAAPNPQANQAGTPTDPAATDNNTLLAAFAGQLVVAAKNDNSAAPGSPAKAPADKSDQDSDGGTDAGATATAATSPTQPVAAVVITADIAPAPANAAAPSNAPASTAATAISAKAPPPSLAGIAAAANATPPAANDIVAASDGSSTPTSLDTKYAAAAQGAKNAALTQPLQTATPDAKIAALPADTKAGAPTPNTKPAPAKPSVAAATSTAAPTTTSTDTSSPTNAADGQAGNAAPQLQARTDSDAAVVDQNSNNGSAHSTGAGETGSTSGAQNSQATAKTDGVPNFGFAAASQTAPAATTAAASTIATPAAAAVPVAGLPVYIAARAQSGSNQFDIRLDPPELGRIDVRLDVDGNGQVTSHVVVDRADTLQLLQSQQPQLQHALEQAGLKTADNGLQFTLRDQSFAGQNGQNGQNNNSGNQTAQLVIPDADQPAIPTTQIYSRVGRLSGIDIRV